MDKDVKPTIEKFIKLCTTDLAQMIKDIDGVEKLAKDQEQLIEDVIEDLRELNYLEPIYGTESRLSFVDWNYRTKKLKNISQVWYSANYLRMLAFTRAEIDFPEKQ